MLKDFGNIDKVKVQLNKILDSNTFRESSNLIRFLEFVVVETLEGRGAQLKQYTIAVQAFDRSTTFDSQKDPIVRIQAGRLRQLLTNYYKEEGFNDKILIEIPKGTYIPEFSTVERLSSKEGNQLPMITPEILVFPFKNLSSLEDNQFIAEGFTEELVTNLSFFKNIVTIRASIHEDNLKNNDSYEDVIPRFCLRGTIRFSDTKIKVVVSLYSSIDNRIIWSMDFNEPYELDQIIEMQERVALKVATSVADVYGGAIVKKIQAETQKMAFQDIDRFDIVMVLYAYLRNPTRIEYDKILDLFYDCVKKYPDFGPGWGALADILINNYILGYTPNCPELLEEGLTYMRKAVNLNPNSQLIRTIQGYSSFVNNQLDECRHQLSYAKSLNPKSAFFIGAIGFFTAMAGDWQNGIEDLKTSFKLNPDYPNWYHIATTLFHLKEKSYEESLSEALKLDIPLIFWDPVLKAVGYAYNDNLVEAEIQLDKLRQILPDFFNQPLFYLKTFIKFDTLLDIVIKGLIKAGLEKKIVTN